jgi:hypothetical protein
MAKEFDPKEIENAVMDELTEITQKVMIATATAVVFPTPVGNPLLWKNPQQAPEGYVGGHARRNWVAAPDVAPVGELPGVETSYQAKLNEIKAVTATFDTKKSSKFWLVNNVPYIGRLNDGWSTQAPRGFIGRGIRAAVRATLPRRKNI